MVLHLIPAAPAFAAAQALTPIVRHAGLPGSFTLTVAFALVLTPVELGILLYASRRATGRWSVRALPAVLSFRRRPGRWLWAVPILLPVAFAIAAALTPVSDTIAAWTHATLPPGLVSENDPGSASRTALLVAGLVTLLIDGLLNPAVEELYFRGYLLPRLPASGWRAVPISAALFAVQHYWQPQNWLLIFILQTLATGLVVRSRSFRLGIVFHTISNSLGILLGLIPLLVAG